MSEGAKSIITLPGGGGGGGSAPGAPDNSLQYRINGTTLGGIPSLLYDSVHDTTTVSNGGTISLAGGYLNIGSALPTNQLPFFDTNGNLALETNIQPLGGSSGILQLNGLNNLSGASMIDLSTSATQIGIVPVGDAASPGLYFGGDVTTGFAILSPSTGGPALSPIVTTGQPMWIQGLSVTMFPVGSAISFNNDGSIGIGSPAAPDYGTSGQAIISAGAASPVHWGDVLSTSLSNGNFLVGNGSNVAAAVAPTGDVTFDNTGAFTIGSGKVTNAMLAGSIAASNLVGTDIATVGTITTGTWSATAIAATKGGTGLTSYALGDTLYSSASNTLSALAGNTTSTKKFLTQTGTGSASAAPSWATIAAADYPTMVGDSGSGGTKGAVPAPASGDAAANKFLKADGTWTAISTGVTGSGSTAKLTKWSSSSAVTSSIWTEDGNGAWANGNYTASGGVQLISMNVAGSGGGTLAPYNGTGRYCLGINVQTSDTTTGRGNAGFYSYVANGNKNVGGYFMVESGGGTSPANIGVVSRVASTTSATTYIGGYFRLDTTNGNFNTIPTGTAALIADNGGTSGDVLDARVNGTTNFKVDVSGIVTIGAGTSTQHILNTQLGTAASDVLTMTNGPTGKAGNPAGYVQITINGSTRVIPYW